jgi:hypothetical protein
MKGVLFKNWKQSPKGTKIIINIQRNDFGDVLAQILEIVI